MWGKPAASVIVTTRNEEKNIEHCLRSVRNQTVKNIEVILVDACSADRTVKVARKYINHLVVRKCGVAEGRNVGAKIARADVLVFLDADSMLLPETLEEILKAYKRRGVVGASCPVLPISADIRYVSVYMFYNSMARVSTILRKPQIAGMFCTYRRDAFEKVGGFSDDVGILEDFHLSMRIGKLGRVKFLTNTIALTSHRRLEKMGMRVPDRYLLAWLRLMLTGRSFSLKWYDKHMAR
ncbi:MAG: glycosyltransferase [Candidatus Aenigmarchaeota archaeon]|nr:glycosyltransferase [Candidatus Aenigmarchaeota archaeon]